MTRPEIETRPYDSAAYLESDEDIREYLIACFEEAGDDPAMIAHGLGVVARAKGMMKLARETGLSRESLYRALSARGNPEFGTVLKVLRALGFQLTPIAAGDVASRDVSAQG